MLLFRIECKWIHRGVVVGKTRNVIRSKECCCEPIRMNIAAMVMHDLYGLETFD